MQFKEEALSAYQAKPVLAFCRALAWPGIAIEVVRLLFFNRCISLMLMTLARRNPVSPSDMRRHGRP